MTIARVKHLVEANTVLARLQEKPETSIYFPAKTYAWKDAVVVTITDASWANDSRVQETEVYKRRSQYGRIKLLAPPTIWGADTKKVPCHFIGWKSGLIRRVCR